jgi:hypothetical protein
MASPFAEAITQSMVAGLDPMNGVIRQYASQTMESNETNVIAAKADSITKIEQLLTQAKDRGADATVIAAYQKLLGRLVS